MEYLQAFNAKVGSMWSMIKSSPPTGQALIEVWFLYARAFNSRRAQAQSSSFDDLKKDFIVQEAKKLMKFTYRNHFEPIVGNVTTDSGWGCTGRSAQMLLANCILRSHFELSTDDENSCVKVLSHFRDTAAAAFSIHAITSTSMSLFGKLPTEWLGPSSASRIVELLVNQHSTLLSPSLRALVASDAMVAVDDVSNLLSNASVLLLVPLRLGVEKLNVHYIHPLLSMFTLPQFAGFIGGQQSSSFFFVGAEIPVDPTSTDGSCYYLDPHLVQESDHTGVGSYKVLDVGRINVCSLDPSLSLGFYVRDSTEWEILTTSIKSIWANTEYPLFTLLSAEDSMKLQDNPSGLEFAVDDFDMS
eukprot:TRINITY_DN6890_c0_g1_i1.p1 TRINITY_DN6890_c0_g1~~TRINITY_DN6890_c0_g1_i1.p1  ORF type:complete len:358 (-),score=35.98 TRINITY_DN6890_c0_g1_i1:46-1119(-)